MRTSSRQRKAREARRWIRCTTMKRSLLAVIITATAAPTLAEPIDATTPCSVAIHAFGSAKRAGEVRSDDARLDGPLDSAAAWPLMARLRACLQVRLFQLSTFAVQAQIKATTHPISVHPRSKLVTLMATLLR